MTERRIAPIPTKAYGCRFRSRLEARWATFFKAAGVQWKYEPQGYSLPSGNYLPDFLIQAGPDSGIWTWFEVKPSLDLTKPLAVDPRWGELAMMTRQILVVAEGMHREGDNCLKSHRSTAFSPQGTRAQVNGLWRMAKFHDAWDKASGASFEFGESGTS